MRDGLSRITCGYLDVTVQRGQMLRNIQDRRDSGFRGRDERVISQSFFSARREQRR